MLKPIIHTIDQLANHLGGATPRSLSWHRLTRGGGIPWDGEEDLYGRRGLYAVTMSDKIVYIGKSKNLSRRLGQLIGAVCGGRYGLHSGGHTIWARWGCPNCAPPITDMGTDFVVHVWVDEVGSTELYGKERTAIKAAVPPCNKERLNGWPVCPRCAG